MLDTPDSPEAQEPTEGDAQPAMPMGPAIEAIQRVPDDATWARLLLNEVCTVIVRTDISLAVRAFYLRLLLRLDRKRGVVDDSVPWLATHFGTSERSVQHYTAKLALAGLLIVRRREVSPGNNLPSEIAFPALAKACLTPGADFAPPPGADFAPNEVGASSHAQGIESHATRSDERGARENAKNWKKPTRLRHWKLADYWQGERELVFDGEVKIESFSIDEWRYWLAHYGGSPPGSRACTRAGCDPGRRPTPPRP